LAQVCILEAVALMSMGLCRGTRLEEVLGVEG